MRSPRADPAFDPRRRIGTMAAIFALLLMGLVAQLLRIQVLERDRYVSWGEDQRLVHEPLPGDRGDIFDRNGEELAISLNAPMVYADPLLVTDPATEAEALAPVLGVEVADVQALLATEGRFVYLARQTTEDVAQQVRALGLDGVFIDEEPQRFHPAGQALGRGVLGFVGFDNQAWSGLEVQYDNTLAGIPGELISERGLNGRTIPEGERERRPAVDGADLALTIDRALQFEVEQTLAEHVVATGAQGGVVIITEPATGDILAMASIGRDEDGDVGVATDNRAVTWVYEPASVMKAVTFAAVLDEGIATRESARTISDEIQIYEETFTDDERYGERVMSVTDILVRSSNTGTILWAEKLGRDRFHSHLEAFGFGSQTALGFPGESAGLLPDAADWSGTSFATIAIGQGIAVTPVQMLMSFNALANGGLYVAPRLVSTVTTADGETHVPATATRRVVSQQTADDVTEMLTRVAQDGTARNALVPGYKVAAKTGTARKALASGGYQDADGNFHHVATVAGFFPADDPGYSMIVILDEPTTEIYASRVAAPLFAELAGWTLRHYRVSPGSDLVLDKAPISPQSGPAESAAAVGDDDEAAAGPAQANAFEAPDTEDEGER
jgi:cell division protein FtsI (penicillin-binding protein 3)